MSIREPQLALGRVISERYRVHRFIARGGMGEVYEAFDMTLRRRIAIKTILQREMQVPVAKERFLREIRLALDVTHENVCRLYDWEEHKGGTGETDTAPFMFLTMELLLGPTLTSKVQDRGKLAPHQVALLVEQMVEGIAAIHRKNIIHRDLKSSNVMLVREPTAPSGQRVVITDLGLAVQAIKEEDSRAITEAGHRVGTPAYMAPEQFYGGELSPATDIWALGVMIYEMLTGQLPRRGKARSIFERHRKEPFPLPRHIVHNLDPVWDEVVRRCTQFDPDDRFRVVGEIVHCLKQGLRKSRDGKDLEVVFLMPSGQSDPVDQLAERLSGEGVELVCLAPQNSNSLIQTLQRARACCLWVAKDQPLPWARDAIREALEWASLEPGFQCIPTLMHGARLPKVSEIPNFLRHVKWIKLREGDLDSAAAELIRRLEVADDSLDSTQIQRPGFSPYRGLESFDSEHHHLFFGRDALIQRLCEGLRENNALVLVGASGSGKSSVLKAGLLPAIKTNAQGASESWNILLMRPRLRPVEELVGQMQERAGQEEGSAAQTRDLIQEVWGSESTFVSWARRQAAGDDAQQQILLVIDQFEEIFLEDVDPRERDAFLDNVMYAHSFAKGLISIVIALRADLYPRALTLPGLSALLTENQEFIPSMNSWELRDVIEKPLRNTGFLLQEGLAETILGDLRDNGKHPLPLLEYCLRMLWERRVGKTLSLSVYQAIGGVQGAISQHAEEVYAAIPAEQQDKAKQIFLELIQLGYQAQDSRRRCPVDTFTVDDGVQRTLEHLTRARLVVRDRDPHTGDEMVELVHEALILHWSRLQGWLEESRRALMLKQNLQRRAASWVELGESTGALLGREELEYFRKSLGGDTLKISGVDRRFLDQSQSAITRNRWSRGGVWATVGTLVVALVLSWVMNRKREKHDLLADLGSLEPTTVLNAIYDLSEHLDLDAAAIRSELIERQDMTNQTRPDGKTEDWRVGLLGKGPRGVHPDVRAEVVLAGAQILWDRDADPWQYERVAMLLWALDSIEPSQASMVDEMTRLRQDILSRYRQPPPLGEKQWVELSGLDCPSSPSRLLKEGTMKDKDHLGTESRSFRMLRHEVTHAEMSQFDWRLVDKRLEENHPAEVTWYQAYVYAAWRGGRLPTYCEWSHAALGSCDHNFCKGVGLAAEAHEVAWFLGQGSTLQPVEQLASNQWGLYDMFGNAREWIANWSVLSLDAVVTEPWAADASESRSTCGGWYYSHHSEFKQCYGQQPKEKHATSFRIVIELGDDLRPIDI